MGEPADLGAESSTQPKTSEERFVRSLEALLNREDRGALAALRGGLSRDPGEWAPMYRYVVPWLPQHAAGRKENLYYQIAALFAWWYQGRSSVVHNGKLPANFGESFARLSDATNGDSVERRFVALLNCHSEDLSDHLRHAVGLLRTNDIPVNWVQLLRDIQGWDWESRSVQRAWARSYWGRGQRDANQESVTTITSNDA